MISESKLSILQCPVCNDNLSQAEGYLVCTNCKSKYPVIDDIVVFLTKENLDCFLGETWGGELQKECDEFYPGFFFASNESPIEDLWKLYEEAANECKAGRLYNTGDSPQDSGLPEEQDAAIEKSLDDIVELSNAVSAKRILDWPTGPGSCLRSLTKYIAPETLVVALDVNFRSLARIKPYYDKNGLSDKILFIAADARRMPLKDGVFQSVTVWGVNEIERPEVGFKETYRVLEDGGWLATSGEQYKENSPSIKIAERLGMAATSTRVGFESTIKQLGFKNLQYEVLYEDYDRDDLPDEERCPLPARGDWFQVMVASGQKKAARGLSPGPLHYNLPVVIS